MATRGKRKKKVTQANPLFIQWLTEWKEEADGNGWKNAYTYGKALSSLKKYPLNLKTGSECQILSNFGPKICSMLDKKLEEHVNMYGSTNVPTTDESSEEVKSAVSPHLRKQKTKQTSCSSLAAPKGGRPYVPAPKSGAYAIMMTLYDYTQVQQKADYMLKADLIRLAQSLATKSFTVPDTGSFYTAFSSMSILTKKHLVAKAGNPVRYSLTQSGIELVQNMKKSGSDPTLLVPINQPVARTSRNVHIPKAAILSNANDETLTSNQVAAHKQAKKPGVKKTRYSLEGDITRPAGVVPSYSTDGLSGISNNRLAVPVSATSNPLFTLNPGQFEVVLIVDNREHFGSGRSKQYILPALAKNGVKFDVRPLSVGDFVWIAKPLGGQSDKEVILDFCVERKRLDDLSGSIIDGRYKEQKMRMKQCGLRKPVYLVEYVKTQQHEKIKEDTLLQAVMNTQIIEGFFVKRCEDIQSCVAYLTLMTRYLCKQYTNKTIHGYTRAELPNLPYNALDMEMCHLIYSDFNTGAKKSKLQTASELWKRLLLVIPGVAVDKANILVEKYPTMNSMFKAYARCDTEAERKKLVSNLKSGAVGRRFGDVLSRNIASLLYSEGSLR